MLNSKQVQQVIDFIKSHEQVEQEIWISSTVSSQEQIYNNNIVNNDLIYNPDMDSYINTRRIKIKDLYDIIRLQQAELEQLRYENQKIPYFYHDPSNPKFKQKLEAAKSTTRISFLDCSE